MAKRFSVARALAALSEDRLKNDAPYESDASAEIAERIGRPAGPGYVYVRSKRAT
jgi:hypothetical protein